MKKLLLTIAVAIIMLACKKEIKPALPVDSLLAKNIDCKACMQYVGATMHNGFTADKAVFCNNYCEAVKKLGKEKLK